MAYMPDYEDEYEDFSGADDIDDTSDDYDGGVYGLGLADRISQAAELCVVPSVQATLLYMSTILLCCFGFRAVHYFAHQHISTHSPLAKIEFLHAASFCFGITALYLSVGQLAGVVFMTSMASFLLLHAVQCTQRRYVGQTVAVITIFAQFLCESLQEQPEEWHRLRGVQMVATMKVISLAFDAQDSQLKYSIQRMPNIIEYLGYMFNPASCVMGPWLSFRTYVHGLQFGAYPNSLLECLTLTTINVVMSVGALVISNCFAPALAIGLENHHGKLGQIIMLYFTALSVRTSHYFICFLSQAFLCAAGTALHTNASLAHVCFGHLVTNPLSIELPRSLSVAVRAWNMPMHDWLKTYIYPGAVQCFGSYQLAAIVCTYLVSSMLHGMHAHIYVVLLSLAFFAYVEQALRSLLARNFKICIGANPCKHETASSVCTAGSWLTIALNSLFSLNALFNLAYLGVMLSENPENKATSFDLQRWQNLSYLNHWITGYCFVVYMILT